MSAVEKAAPVGGLFPFGAALLLVDSITEAPRHPPGCVVVSGSHGGASVVYAAAARPRLAVFNDAGIGKDEAGVAALPALQALGVAACAVAHDSARIGEALSTWNDGVVSRANAAAQTLGARAGLRLRDWLSAVSAGSSPGRR